MYPYLQELTDLKNLLVWNLLLLLLMLISAPFEHVVLRWITAGAFIEI